jgi:hypothetical protein
MLKPNSFPALLTAGLLAVGCLGLAPPAMAGSSERLAAKPHKAYGGNAIELKRRVRGRRILLPMGPAYIYYDYPYYYSRGYYPTHIGGYVYYPYHYYYRRYTKHGTSPRRPRGRR